MDQMHGLCRSPWIVLWKRYRLARIPNDSPEKETHAHMFYEIARLSNQAAAQHHEKPSLDRDAIGHMKQRLIENKLGTRSEQILMSTYHVLESSARPCDIARLGQLACVSTDSV